MKTLIIVLSTLAAACGPPEASDEATAALAGKTPTCASITSQIGCLEARAEGCHWELHGKPIQQDTAAASNGVCVGLTAFTCSTIDQCESTKSAAACAALPTCQVETGSCPAGVKCPTFICAPKDPCVGIDLTTCAQITECVVENEFCGQSDLSADCSNSCRHVPLYCGPAGGIPIDASPASIGRARPRIARPVASLRGCSVDTTAS